VKGIPYRAKITLKRVHGLNSSQIDELCEWLMNKAREIKENVLQEKEKYADHFTATIDF